MLKRFTSIASLAVLFLYTNVILSQGTCASPYNMGTIGSGTTCATFASPGTTGSAPCAGAGYGGNSGGVTYVKFCTGATVQCINFNITDGTTTGGNWAVTVYSNNCSTSVDAQCLGNSGSGSSYNTSSPTTPLQPNSCYIARFWSANAGSFSLCATAMTPTNDLCGGATPIGPALQQSSNFCMTAGTAGDPAPGAFCAGSLENNAWYTFTTSPTCVSPCTVVVTVNNIVCSGGGSGFQIGYFTGSCGSLTNIGCTSGSGGTVTATITNLTPGQVVTIGIDGNAGANCTYGISASNTIPVPIELYEFKGTMKNEFVHLTWSTATEINNDYFTVERSENATDFYSIKSIKGAGNSSKPLNYSFDDQNPVNHVAYYRLKQTDLDGRFSYSRTIAVVSAKDNKLSVAPNPANDAVVITYNCGASSEEIMNVYDNKGNIVMSKKLICSEGLNKTSVDISELNPGMYMVFVSLGDKLYKTRLVKN